MKFGEFDDQNYEYIIHRPDTPLPWINYLGCQDYFGIISNTAGGYSFYRDARLRRLTRYRYNNIPFDANGRYLYLRDRANGEFWSPTWQPVRKSLDVYECRHGLGYSTIASQYKGISVQIRYFVPLDENLEIWQVTVTNTRAQAAAISLFSFVEFCLWDALDDASNFQRNFSTGEVEVEDGVIYHKTEYRERRDHFAFFACSEKINGFDTQRQDFLGAYRGLEAPQVVEQGNCNNSIAHGWAPVGVHQVDLDLAGGETRNLVFLLGYQENALLDKFDPPGSNCINKRAVKTLIERYTQPSQVQAAFERLSDYWRQLVGVFQVQTPDVHTNRMVNIWNAYQCMVTFNMSRSASFFESGIGRGMGFRDTTQDMLGFVHMAPERARQRLLDVAATHLESGGAYHQYQPLTKRGNDAVGTNFNDDPLWLVLAVAAYLKESADWSILQEQVPYDNRPGSEQPLLEHLQRCIRYTLQRLGPHGLPLIGRADWNDCLNLNAFSTQSGESFQTTTNKDGKVAESVFIAGLFVLAAHEMAEISTRIGDMSAAQAYLEEAAKMEQTTLQHGWDGSWFLRAYDDFGKPVGSHTCEEGQIFIEPQGICVLAGIGLFSGQAQQALDSVSERLVTQHGIVLQQPPYTRYYLNLGEISTYPPGYKENAGVFCHTNPWIMIGETRLGRGEQALVHYLRINPSAREAISEIHKTEPYVYAQMIAGKDAPSHGEAKNSWLSGTAAWNYVAISQWILGVRPHYDGLLLAPVVPPAWQSFRMQRVFRHTVYDISVNRQGPGNQVSIRVNDKPVDGNLIAPQPGCKLDVEVTLF